MVNSCLGLFSATVFRRRPLFRSYGTNLPSSLTTLLPLALGFSPHLPVSVCGTGASSIHIAFSRHRASPDPPHSASLSPGSTNGQVQLSPCVTMLNNFGGYGISTVCASTTPFGLALAPGLPWADEPSPRNLRFSAIMIPTLILATHSGILTRVQSTIPSGMTSPRTRRSPTTPLSRNPKLRLYA